LNDNLRKSYADVKSVISQKEGELVEASVVEKLKQQISDLEVQKGDYKKQAEKNNLELSRKNKELVDKIQELDVLKI